MDNQDTSSSFVKLFPCILLCLFVGWMGGVITEHSVATWYPTLVKPSWTPPNWVFPIIWSILYILMGISLWLLWISKTRYKFIAYLIFAIQLALNFAWSWIFFYQQKPFWAFLEILLLWIAVAGMIVTFRYHSKLAAYLQVPYLLWITYAITLNFFIWFYN